MRPEIRRPDLTKETLLDEGCWIVESSNQDRDEAVSIARARVESGVTTKPHRLKGIVERYLIVKGAGVVSVGDLPPSKVEPGDVVIIPADVTQQIHNPGPVDLIFYCICTPRFVIECYESLGDIGDPV